MAEIVRDLELLRNYPLIVTRKKAGVGITEIKMHGWLYDISVHKLTNVEDPETKQATCEVCERPLGTNCGCICQCHKN